MTFESYSAKVKGIIWNGTRGYTFYDFDHKPTRQEVMDRSGDFRRVTSIKLTRKLENWQTVACS